MLNRRDFLKSGAILAGAIFAGGGLFAHRGLAGERTRSDFTLWQLPLHQSPKQGNSYVFKTKSGKIVMMDGGVPPEAGYLRGFLAALGNKVDLWLLSHPHSDHIGALNEILKEPDGISIGAIYHSAFSPAFYESVEPQCQKLTAEFYENLKKVAGEGVKVVDVTEPGLELAVDDLHFKVLDVKDERVKSNPYNNSCMIVRAWDSAHSFLFLGDAGKEQGDRLLAGPYRKELDCDFLQMAHHGQKGVRPDFYRTIKFNACLWPTPRWLFDNNAGKGYNTHTWETVKTRKLMDEIGIKKHFYGWKGLEKIVEGG